MKRIAFFLAFLFLISISGCNRNNRNARIKKDISVVIRENEELEDYLYLKDMIPIEVNDQWGNTLINLSGIIPDVGNLPVDLYISETFSPDQIKTIIDTIAGETVQVYEIGQPSLDYYKKCLEEEYSAIELLEKELAEFKSPYTVDEYNVETGEQRKLTIDEDYLKEQIRILKDGAANYAHIIDNYEQKDRQPIELQYAKDDLEPSSDEMILKGSFDHQGENCIVHTYCYGKMLMIGKRDLGSIAEGDPVQYSNLQDDGTYEKRIGVSRQTAVEIAQRFADSITGDMKCRISFPAFGYVTEDNEEYVWQCYFTKDIHGTEVTFEDHEIESADLFRNPIRYESLSIAVSDKGVIGMTWQFPLAFKEQLTEDVKLMPISEVLEIAKKYFSVQDYRNLEINKMKLSYSRIDKQGDEEAFYYVPVWDFYGTLPKDEYDPWMDLDRYSFLTINALDGTIIDRSLGY